MGAPGPSASAPRPPSSPPEEARRLFAAARELSVHHDPARHVEALKAFVAFVDGHRKALEDAPAEFATLLDEAGVQLYKRSELEVAARAIETGLALAPGSSSLLHHRALVLLAQNRSRDEVLPLLDEALQANPHDKQIWATKGDALKLLNRPTEAVEAYLKAQQLDATSMQYVERALKLAPQHPLALRMKLQLAKAHGGDRQALEACEALLVANPDDGSLLVARAELLAGVGQIDEALRALDRAETARAGDPKVALLRGRFLAATGRAAEALAPFRQLLAATTPPDTTTLEEIAEIVERTGADPAVALEARERLRTLSPRNLGNLSALRALAITAGRTDLALATCEATLEVSPQNLEAMRSRAELLASAKRTPEAMGAYRDLLAAHPKEVAEARRAVAFARDAGDTAAIIEFARLLLAAEPDDPAAQEELAQALALTGDRAGALGVYDRLLEGHPDAVRYLWEKKQLLSDLGKTDELPPVLDELFRHDPTRSDLAVERGHLYLARAFDSPEGSPERESAAREALVSYERASLDPTLAARSTLGVARASRLVGDHERAIRAYQEFLARPGTPPRADIEKELGHALREVGRLTEAEEAYARAVDLGLEDPDLFWGESEVLSLLNQEAKALRFVDLLLAREPQNPLFLRRKGQLLLKAGRRSEGLQALKEAVREAHGDPHAFFEVAEALRAHGAYADAIGYYHQGLEIDPKSRPGRLALAETLVLAGQYNEALPVIDTLLREDPNELAAWKIRADAHRSLRRPSELLYSLKAILLLDPHNAPALLEKHALHLEKGERTEAFDCLSAVVDGGGAEGNDPAVLLAHGDLAAEIGRTEEANRSYERAQQLDPGKVASIAVRRARLRLTAGRPDLALEVLDPVLGPATAGAPRNAEALGVRAEILGALERPGEAEAVYREVLAQDAASPVALAGVGRSLLDQGKHAEAREFLTGAIPKVAPSDALYLLLAEALSGLGAIPDAVDTVHKGVELMPRSAPLWVRLGELEIAREGWPESAGAFAHAIAIDPQNAPLHLRAGFVAEKLGHPNEALALYDRATQIAPSDKNAWTSRGLALLATGRPDDARASFERALALDSDFEAAKEGKKAATQKTREAQIERFGREALLLEAKLHRTVTKNDLFVTLHVPFDLLEPVLAALGRNPRVAIDRLSESEMRDLEMASYHLITTALQRRPEGIERRGFTLADVAVLSPANATLDQVQRLFGYLRSVLELDLRAENLKLTADVEELARRALLLPESQRTLFQLVRTLRVGVYKARVIKAVESAGAAVHAPLPTLDLSQFSPEFRDGEAPSESPAEGSAYFAPENVPAPAPEADAGPEPSVPPPSSSARCVGCGGIAAVVHDCGAAVCQHCIAQFHTCPKCGRAISPPSTRASSGPPAGGAHREPSPAGHAGHPAAHPAAAATHPVAHAGAHAAPHPPAASPAAAPAARDRSPLRSVFGRSKAGKPAPPPAPAPVPPAPAPGSEETEAPPPPRPPRPKPDDEPRL